MRNYYGEDAVCPVYIQVEDGERLARALKREREQTNPKYEEMCRRFLADQSDFSEENILAAGIILMGLLQISSIKKTMPVNLTVGERFQEYFKPGLMVVAGACLLFNQSGTIAWAFIATGVLLVINGIMTLVGANKTY